MKHYLKTLVLVKCTFDSKHEKSQNLKLRAFVSDWLVSAVADRQIHLKAKMPEFAQKLKGSGSFHYQGPGIKA